MKQIKRKLNNRQIATICLLIASILFLSAYVVISVVIANIDNNNSGTDAPLDLLPGESSYLNQPIAYPTVNESAMLTIEVNIKGDRYGVSRYPDDLGSFMFHYYKDGSEEIIPYIPPIYSEDPNFTYESLYAIEQNDSFGRIYLLTYLCTAIGTPYFTERIELPAVGDERRDALLREYGFTQGEYSSIAFTYGTRDTSTGHIIEGTEGDHIVLLGKKAVSGSGYYFMVDGRDYVYYTTGNYFDYAMAGFESFVKGMLVTGGLESDSTYGPYLTTDFKNWIGTVHNRNEEEYGPDASRLTSELIDGAEVIIGASASVPIDKGLDFVPEASDFNGYTTSSADMTFDMQALKKHPDYARIRAALEGVTVGSGKSIPLTLLKQIYQSEEKLVDLTKSDSLSYTYHIEKIEAAITDTAERSDGEVLDTDTYVKVTYSYTVGDKSTAYSTHGVLKLSDLPAEESARLIGQPIGEALSAPIDINITYNADNALKSNEKYVLTSIISIFDENGEVTKTVTDTSYVNISYYCVLGGTKSDTATTIVRLCDIKDDSKLAPLKTILLGKGKGSLNETVYDTEYYYEVMREFTFYDISDVKFFVTNEIVASFKFANVSERDPFYGETFFQNTLTNENKLYGLNSGVCEGVVKLLGGIGNDSSSAMGISGTTVAVGLTLENMQKYGLYSYRIYFELPRGLYDASEEAGDVSDDTLSDYGWLSVLGFTLYISEDSYDEDGNRIRYIGSDMYDLVAKVDASLFDFAEEDFIEYWARRNLLMMNIEKLERIDLDFNMADMKGSYDFEVLFREAYSGYLNGEYVISNEKFDGSSPFTEERVNVSASSDAFETLLKTEADKYGNEWYSLTTLYNKVHGDGEHVFYPGSRDSLGVASFNSVYEILQLTRYENLASEEDKVYDDAYRVLRMNIKVAGSDEYYTYDFYRIDDRRVLVSLYRTDENGNKIASLGEVSDFYISTFAFKKLVGGFVDILNGKEIDGSVAYE